MFWVKKGLRSLCWLVAILACAPLALGVAFFIEYQRFCTPWDEFPGYHVAECWDIQRAALRLTALGAPLVLPLLVMLVLLCTPRFRRWVKL
ncbi:hypothetical protein [Jannaschia sp. CCS1]|uniref:hypothetical protein n=1 Tax=Jannaschia sp. (strain CCS1) TaxID=290400 RepID=UPI000301A07F|nr:hypothetical protein [Jannaschia sp. CCS1]